MSLPWYRIGKNPAVPVIPLPITELFYLAYADASGREHSAFSYDPSTQSFTLLLDTPIEVIKGSSFFSVLFNGTEVMHVENQTVNCATFSEFELPLGQPALLFYRKSSSLPDRLAALDSNGVFYCKSLNETVAIPTAQNEFQVFNNGVLTFAIAPTGVFALNISEDAPDLATDTHDFLIFSDGSRWAV